MLEDKEIYELVDKKNADLVERIEKTLKLQTQLLLEENQGIKKSIDNLAKNVSAQNGRIDNLESWKDKVEGGKIAIKELTNTEHNKTIRYVAIASICVSFIVAGITVFNSCATNKVKGDISTVKNQLHYKQDKLPDGTTRSISNYSITSDTAFTSKLEEEIKEY